MAFEDYEEEEEELKLSKPIYKRVEFWIVLFLVAFYALYRGRIGYSEIDNALLYLTGGITFIVLLKTSILALKHLSPKIVFNPSFSTFDGTIYRTGNYCAVRLGGIKAGGIYWKGSDGTIIFPVTAVNKVGRCAVSLSRVEFVEPMELPPEIITLIRDRKLPPPYLFGLADEEQELEKPDIVKIEHELKERNKQLNMLRSIKIESLDDVEKLTSAISRIGQITGRKSPIEKVREILKRGE